MKNGKYQLGIVGFGGMGNWHFEHIISKNTDELRLEVAGVFDINPERQTFAEDNKLKAYQSLDELLADEDIDIVLCATPNEVHREITEKALRSGKNVVCEKPVTMSSEDLTAMINVANETGKLFTVHQNRRWDADFRTAKKIYDENMLGEIFEIQSRVYGSRGIPGDWRGKKENGGGMVLDWGVHIIDQALLMIDSKIKSIYATMQYITNSEVDDGFRIVLNFENGLSFMLEVMTSTFINLPRWTIYGIDGSATIEGFRSEKCDIVRIIDKDKNDAIPIRTAAGFTKTMAPRTDDTIKSETMPLVETDIKDFYKNVIATIEGKETQLIKHDELMRVMKVMEAAFQSAEIGQIVPFE